MSQTRLRDTKEVSRKSLDRLLTHNTVRIGRITYVVKVKEDPEQKMAPATLDQDNSIIPARLSFLAIYNPSLGRTDDTFRDQVVFYHSRIAHERRRTGQNDDEKDPVLQEEENEQLRQIGLAQGMINFAQ
jgi:hypothetical protein